MSKVFGSVSIKAEIKCNLALVDDVFHSPTFAQVKIVEG